jgi:superfamily II DNA or RNA helicase
MNFNSKKEFQSAALQSLKENNYTGVVVADMGSGKAKVSVDVIKEGRFRDILITSPRTNLKENWKKELEKWGLEYNGLGQWVYYNSDTFFVNITLENIQTCYKWDDQKISDFDLIIIDEIHTIGTEYFKLIIAAQLFDVPIIGLTATPNKKDDWKREVLYKAVPILIEYYNAEEDKLVNSCRYWVYEYELTDNYKVLTGTKTKKWLVGEAKQYTYLTEQYDKAKNLMFAQGAKDYFNQSLIWMQSKTCTKEQKVAGVKFFLAVRKRKEFLWNLESSKQIALALKKKILDINLKTYKDKTGTLIGGEAWTNWNKVLLFSELTSQAEKLSPYSIHSNNGTSAKEIESNNKELLEQFNNGIIRELSSVRSLQLGLNMNGATHAIFESYSSSEVNSKQAKGRLNRLDIDNIANIIIIRPLNTQASTWFSAAFDWIRYSDYTVIHSVEELKI